MYVTKGDSLRRKQMLGFMAGGPIMTLLLLLIASYLARYFAAYAGIHYFSMGFLFEYLSISCDGNPANLS